MSDNFMVTLLSNGSMTMYPANTGSNFTNKLGEPIDLRGAVMNDDMSWEVAMADFQYTNVFDSVNKTVDCRIALIYPKGDADAEAAALVMNRYSLGTNEIGDTTHGGVSGDEGGSPDARAKPSATATTAKQRPIDKSLLRAAREAWEKGSMKRGIGAIMLDHQLKAHAHAMRPDTTDERIMTYIEGTYNNGPSALRGQELSANDIAIVQVKIERGSYESPVAVAYIIAATYNLLIDQLVNRPDLNTQLHVQLDPDGKITFVNNDLRVRHMLVVDDDRLAKSLGLRVHPLDTAGPNEPPLQYADLFGLDPPWFGNYVPNMFLYCDIVADQYVGDVMAPLLDLVPVKRAGPGERVQYSLIPPTYLEVARKYIDTIHMEIRDDTGAPVQFDDRKGPVVVRLHFRRKGTMPAFVM